MPALRAALISASASASAVSVLSLALAGCSSAASSASSAAAPSQGTLDGVPKTCPSAAVVMADLQLSQLVLAGPDPSLCEYLFKGSKTAPYVVITFNAAPGFTPAAFGAQLKRQQSHVQAAPGLAEAAFTFTGTAGGTGLSFISGGTVCSILSTVPTTTAGKTALAQAILAG